MSETAEGGETAVSAGDDGDERDSGEAAVRPRSVWRPAVRPGPGSWRLLAWLARLGVAGVEPLALALAISRAKVYSHVARLAEEGLVVRVPVLPGGGGVVALTRAGARVAREQGATGVVDRSGRRGPSSGVHGRAVSWVAAWFELRGLQWLGPAELHAAGGWRVSRDDGAGHAPDLGLVRGGERTAVEVELHAKAPRRLEAILRGYRALIDRGGLSVVSYVTGRRDVAALVRRQGDAALLGEQLEIGPLEAIVDRARERAQDARAAAAEGAGDS